MKSSRMGVWAAVLACAGFRAFSAAAQTDGTPLVYPRAKTVDQVDDYHGTKVADPYRWLEFDLRESKDVADWAAQENIGNFAYTNAIPGRDAIKKRVTDLWNYEKVSAPRRHGPRYVFSKNDGLQNQSVYYT